MKFVTVRVLMALAGVYEGVLGTAFLFFTGRTFELMELPPPAHLGAVHFAAALLLVFALMFWCVVIDPVRYAPFISAGMGLKAAGAGLVVYYAQVEQVADIWVWLAAGNRLWLMLFVVIRAALPRPVAARVRPQTPR